MGLHGGGSALARLNTDRRHRPYSLFSRDGMGLKSVGDQAAQ